MTRPLSPAASRDYGMDNLRCLLMMCVVLGHLLEICPSSPGSEFLYRILYVFHMPAFVFLTGYFARYDPRRIVSGWVIPYAVFQTLYLLFSRHVLGLQSQLPPIGCCGICWPARSMCC